jgi:hypothetical protein
MFRLSSLTALLIIAVATVASACGQQQAGVGSSGSGSVPSGSVPSGSPPVVSGDPGSCHGSAGAASRHTVTVSASDNGRSFCVRPGTGVLVVLRGSPARKWTPIHASSGVLTPRPNGRLTLQLGVTGEYFVATHSGTAVISSARPVCASPAASGGSSPSPGGIMSCDSELAFHATVKVHG